MTSQHDGIIRHAIRALGVSCPHDRTCQDYSKCTHDTAEAVVAAVQPLIEAELRAKIAKELRRNRPQTPKTEWQLGYRDGYHDAADQVAEGSAERGDF